MLVPKAHHSWRHQLHSCSTNKQKFVHDGKKTPCLFPDLQGLSPLSKWSFLKIPDLVAKSKLWLMSYLDLKPWLNPGWMYLTFQLGFITRLYSTIFFHVVQIRCQG
uniref:Uncharacterized protein n=1 Tax=Sphaerodactylus townsendi TaxID=933632 RepID=A0ACB8E8V7_9SAUR